MHGEWSYALHSDLRPMQYSKAPLVLCNDNQLLSQSHGALTFYSRAGQPC